jgi:hypothetical protein
MTTRLLTVLVGLAVAIPLAAAPVPKHLFPKDPPRYYPVQKGTRWVYEGDSAGAFVVTNAEKDEKDGATILTITHEWPDGKKSEHQKLAVSRSGVRWLESLGGVYDTPVWLLKTPVRAGEEWTYTTSGPGVADTKGVMRVVGSEDVETPAGKFSAVRVEQKATLVVDGKPAHNYSVTFWYSPEVGLVKWTCGGSGAVLKSFTPGKE